MRAVAKCSVTAERGRCCTVQVKAGVVALKATVGKNTAGFGKRLKRGSYTATVRGERRRRNVEGGHREVPRASMRGHF